MPKSTYDDIAQGAQADNTQSDASWYNSIQWDEMNLNSGTENCTTSIDTTIHSHICHEPK